MLELDSIELLAIVAASLLAGLVKVAFGVGAGAFLTPLLALILPPTVAVALMAPVMLLTDVQAVQHHWGKWSTRHVMVLLPTSVLGIAAGTLFLGWAPPYLIRKAIGAIALVFVVLQLRRFRGGVAGPRIPFPVWGGWIVGFIAGVSSAIAHAGGIVFSVYLLSAGLAKNAFVASVVALFVASSAIKIPLYWQIGILTAPVLLTGLALAPVMFLGGRIGARLNQRISVVQFTWIVTLAVGGSGLLLLVRA